MEDNKKVEETVTKTETTENKKEETKMANTENKEDTKVEKKPGKLKTFWRKHKREALAALGGAAAGVAGTLGVSYVGNRMRNRNSQPEVAEPYNPLDPNAM